MRVFFPIVLTAMLLLIAPCLFGIEVGLASWYGGKFQGRQTANGEIFDTNRLTAAHKTLPFGTIVKVTNLLNNLSVRVRINDRGPFIEGRIIDLSKAAADAIGMTGRGVAPVMVAIETSTSEFEKSNSEGSTESRLLHLQIGAYRRRTNAQRTKARIETLGLKVAVETTESGIYRILVIDVPEPKLEETKRILAKAGFSSFLIRKSYRQAS
jgi:rare lipoprotein A